MASIFDFNGINLVSGNLKGFSVILLTDNLPLQITFFKTKNMIQIMNYREHAFFSPEYFQVISLKKSGKFTHYDLLPRNNFIEN
jgi:hypothetical protein